jgi:hypothetical protein
LVQRDLVPQTLERIHLSYCIDLTLPVSPNKQAEPS